MKCFTPKLPIQAVSDHQLLKNLIISTCLNGIEATLKSEPYVFLFAKAWHESLEAVIKKYPRKKQK